MPLSDSQREYVISAAVELLRNHKRKQLIAILGERLAHGDYPSDTDERELDEIAHAIARAVDAQLTE